MSFAVFLLLLFGLYIAYRYVQNHEKLVEQVQMMNQVNKNNVIVEPSKPVISGMDILKKFLV